MVLFFTCFRSPRPNPPVERDRQQAALVGSLRGFAAPAAPHLARYAFHPTVPLPFARRSALPLRIPAAGKLLPGLLLRISNMKQKPVRARMGALYS